MSTVKMALGEIHRKTSHIRERITPHAMDFGQYPLPFKPYDRGVALPLESGPATSGEHLTRDGLLPFLSDFLYLAYGVTHVRQAGAIPFLFRTVPSAGGLYPCHLYLGVLPKAGKIPDTQNKADSGRDTPETSLFYYDPPGHRLTLLRQNRVGVPDFSGVPRADTALVFIVTASLYNAAWKYRDRALRYVMLDAGHLAENLMLAAGGHDLSFAHDFDDREIGRLLDLDLSAEVPLVLATLGWDRSVSESVLQLASLTRPCFPDVRIRPGEAAYMEKFPLPATVHGLGCRVSRNSGGPRTGQVWEKPQEAHPDFTRGGETGDRCETTLPGIDTLSGLMVQRRSRRNFIRRAVSTADQQTLFSWILADGGRKSWHPWITLAVACQNWDGVADGLYALDPETCGLNLIALGNINPMLAGVCLGQEWVGMAGAVFLCLADFKSLEEAGGIRAYRYAMLAAGRAGQRIYLAAEATGQGCCGIGAIYDEEAALLLGLKDDAALLYALAVGPVKKRIPV